MAIAKLFAFHANAKRSLYYEVLQSIKNDTDKDINLYKYRKQRNLQSRTKYLEQNGVIQ